MSQNHLGVCRICGNLDKLSFEHIPPKSAFNSSPRIFKRIEDHLNGRRNSGFRRGLGKYSLCESCNNRTGGWYGSAFCRWTKQGFEFFDKYKDEKIINLPYYIQPLNVLKQVLIMGLAMSAEISIPKYKEIRRFVLNKRQKYLESEIRVFVYFLADYSPRFSSGMAILDVGKKGGSDFILAEVGLPPFGYCVTAPVGQNKSLAEAKGLYEITWFSKYSYDEWVPIHLRIPTRSTAMPSPLDYRNIHGVE
jgi:hypothetical protein